MTPERVAPARLAAALAIALAASGCAGLFDRGLPADATLLAVWTGVDEPGSAVPFVGYWRPGGFVDLSGDANGLDRVLARYRAGARFEGTSEDGAPVKLAFAALVPRAGSAGVDEPLRFDVEQTGGDPAQRAVLVHGTGAHVTTLAAERRPLLPDADAALRGRADALFRRALASRPATDRFDAMELGAPFVEGVAEVPDVAVVIYPATLVQHVGKRDEIRDERALVFFLWDEARGAPLLEAFGHPDWGEGRGAAETVLTLEPLAWLRIESDPHAYLFVMRQRAAEKLDWAILDLATGRPAIRTP